MPPSIPTPRAGLRESADELVRQLRGGGPALIAMSGGVDSALVASLAFEALGERALAMTLAGPAVSAREVERAGSVARAIGIVHRVRSVDPLALPEYRSNPSDRCFFCRSLETRALREAGEEWGAVQYLDGVHRDDLADDRPGLVAMDRAGFRHPLAEAGWGKAEVRRTAQQRGLPNWDEPSDACLSSRVRHGHPITAELLARIERAETIVRSHGFRQVRVRVEGRSARVEVEPESVPRLTREPISSRVIAELEPLGFSPVVLDVHGYGRAPRSGASP